MHSNSQEHCSSKLSYRSHDRSRGIDLEILQTQEHLKAYLCVHSIPIPAYQGNPKAALATLTLDSEILSCQSYRLEGGQRLLLPEEITVALIKALEKGKDVTISLPGYRTVIPAENFSKRFKSLSLKNWPSSRMNEK